jgi:integrase
VAEQKRRRPRGEGGIHQRADGRWVGTLDLGWRDGKRVRVVVYDRTKTGAARKLVAKRVELATRGSIPTAGMTISRWLDYWLDEIAPERIKPRTLATYRSYVEKYLRPAIGRVRLDKIDQGHVRAVQSYVTSKGLSPTTVLHARRILSTALAAAVRDGRLARNVASAQYVDMPRKAVSGRQGLTAHQAKAVLRAAADDRLASRWLWAFLTGTRQGETLGLRWAFVDLDEAVADVAWSLQRVPYQHGRACGCAPGRAASWCRTRRLSIPHGIEHEVLDGNLVLTRPKTSRSRRMVPLAPPLAAALQVRHSEYLAERPSYVVDHGLVWPRPNGRPVDGRNDWKCWKRLLEAAGAPDVTLHETRHTAASLLREAGVDDGTAAQILGHSDVITTRAYQRDDLRHARRAVAQLAKLLAIGAHP